MRILGFDFQNNQRFRNIQYTPPGNTIPREFSVSRSGTGVRDYEPQGQDQRPVMPLRPIEFDPGRSSIPVIDTDDILDQIKRQTTNTGGPIVGKWDTPDDLRQVQLKKVTIDQQELNGASCVGFMLCYLKYQDQTGEVQDFIIGTGINIVPAGKNATQYRVHLSADKKDSKAGGQSHVEQVCGAQLDAFLKMLEQFDDQDFTTVADPNQRRRFKIANLTVQANVTFQGSQTSACTGCENYWDGLKKTWNAKIKSFNYNLTK